MYRLSTDSWCKPAWANSRGCSSVSDTLLSPQKQYKHYKWAAVIIPQFSGGHSRVPSTPAPHASFLFWVDLVTWLVGRVLRACGRGNWDHVYLHTMAVYYGAQGHEGEGSSITGTRQLFVSRAVGFVYGPRSVTLGRVARWPRGWLLSPPVYTSPHC